MCVQGGGCFQQKMQKGIKIFNCAEIVNMCTKREHFTWHGLHMSGSGKDWITSLLATKIMQIFTTCKPEPPIFLTWKAETNEEDREERSMEEGRNSSSQESGLHRNWQETTISVIQWQAQEVRKVKVEHQKEERRILGQDMVIFYGHNSQWYWEEWGTGWLTDTCSPKCKRCIK